MSNYGFDERDSSTAVTREAMHQPQPPLQQPPMEYGYGYGRPQGWGMRSPYGGMRGMHRGSIETRPFFLTSEFAVSLIAAIGIAITAASSHAFGGWRAWVLIAAIVASYNLSRGIAKAGTKSRADDPREHMSLGTSHGHEGHAHDGQEHAAR